MGGLSDDLDRAVRELGDLEQQLARLAARAAGKREEVARLRESIAAMERGGLPPARTDAILAVLRRGGTAMSPKEIASALHDGGREDELRSVTATLSHLLGRGRVLRQGRGRYLAV